MANTAPIFPLTPNIGYITITSASTLTDGTTSTLLFTAGSGGARVDKITFMGLGTNTATKAMIFINNGSTVATAGNNALIREFTLAGTTASNTVAVPQVEWNCDKVLPAGYRLYAALATAVAAGTKIIAEGGNY